MPDDECYPTEIDALVERKILFKVQVKLQNVSDHSEVFTVMRLTEDDELISKYASRRCFENQDSDLLSLIQENDIVDLKDSVCENEVNSPNKTPGKRSKPLVNIDGCLDEDILHADAATQMSSNKLKKIVKIEKD